MKSINNLLLLGDGETWARQRIDFAGLPEMVQTFLQVAAGAADIPVTRLLGQLPAGLSATGNSDTRNDYDTIAARQELDLRPQLERLDRLILRSEGLDPVALSFAFRPLWRLDAPAAAALALTKAQATQVYAGLGLWPAAVTARLAEAQLVADGVYPDAAAVFAESAAEPCDATPTRDFDPDQPRDPDGRWTASGGAGRGGTPIAASAIAAQFTETDVYSGPPASANFPVGSVPGETGPRLHAPDGTSVELVQQTCAEYIAANCRASILRVFPGQYLDQPIDQVLSDAANGIKAAQTAKKLMCEKRFTK